MSNPISFPSWVQISALLTAGLLASPVAAQSVCGGMGDGGAWIGGIEAASDLSTTAGPFDTTAIAPANGQVVLVFNMSAPGDVRLEAQPADGSDSVFDLLDSNGNLILSDDDSGGGLASRGEATLTPGTYCMMAYGVQGSAATMDIRVGRAEHEALTSGTTEVAELEACTADTPAMPLADGRLDGVMPVTNEASASDVPYLGFEISAPTALTMTATGDDADPVLYLYDGSGTLLAENDDFDGLNSRIDMTDPLAPGYYCLGVKALSDADAPISVEVSEFDESDYLNALYSSGETSPPLDGSYPVTDLGIVETRLRQDVTLGDGFSWFQFEMFDGDLVLIDAIAVGEVDPTIVLFDDLGRQIGQNDDVGGGDLNSQIALPTQPGVYVLGVGQVGDLAGPSVRLALQRYVRARN